MNTSPTGRALHAASLLATLLLAGCAGSTQRQGVSAAMILPDGAARTTLEERQLFIMAVPINSDPPRFPAPLHAFGRHVVCVEFIVTAQGEVERVVAITDAPGCQATLSEAARPFAEAARQAVVGWSFFAAALCRYQREEVECEDGRAEAVAVPITLAYRFEFSSTAAGRSVGMESVR